MRISPAMLAVASVLLLLLCCGAQGSRYSSQSFPGSWSSAGGYPYSRPPTVVPSLSGRAPGSSATPATGSGHNFMDIEHTDDGLVMPLVDCEDATGTEEGLICDKEGYFLTGFQREGHWVSGGGRVPLSQARCCRIAPPREFPFDMGQGQAKPTSVLSVGCHTVSGAGAKTQCEADSHSFARGFAEAVKVSSGLNAYYPLSPISCCTPAVLLDNMELWSTKRCDCKLSAHTSCDDIGSSNSSRLIVGFNQARESRSKGHVPLAPVQCCKTCLGSQIMDTSCAPLNKCSGHGSCNFGACECSPGWAGEDCSLSDSGGRWVPWWQLLILIVGGIGILASLLVLGGHVYVLWGRYNEEDDEQEMQDALLLRLTDDAGSVGSEDTTDEDDDLEDDLSQLAADTEEPVAEERAAEEEREEAETEHGQSNTELGSDAGGDSDDDRDAGDEVTPSESRRPIAPLEVEEPPAQVEATDANADCCSEDDPEEEGYGDCNICFSRPIQVVVVPCGHACMCRRCSRRVARCPICRQDVLRRQRLFMGK